MFLGVEVRLQRRRGRTQDHNRIRHLRAHHRDIARVIARHFFLLVRRILLFVHNHQRQIRDRREHCRARADHHARLSALDAMPLLGALLVGQARVQNGHFFPEQLMQIGRHCRRQPDFRHQQDRRAPRFQHGSHGGEINRRLARAGDPVQQHAGKLAGVHLLLNALQRRLLRCIELKVERRGPRLKFGHGEAGRLFDDLDHAALHQRAQRGARNFQRLQRLERDFPPAAARVSIRVCWLALSLPSVFFSTAISYGARRVARFGQVFAHDPLLSHHAGQQRFRARASTSARFPRAWYRVPPGSQAHGISANWSSGVFCERADDPDIPARCSAVCPWSVMR